MSDNKWVGVSVEAGDKVFDPMDFLKLHDIAPTVFPHPKWLRESELKHCRIAMLASVGAFTAQWGLVIPGYTANADPVTNWNNFVSDWPLGFSQILATIAVIEGVSNPTVSQLSIYATVSVSYSILYYAVYVMLCYLFIYLFIYLLTLSSHLISSHILFHS